MKNKILVEGGVTGYEFDDKELVVKVEVLEHGFTIRDFQGDLISFGDIETLIRLLRVAEKLSKVK